MFNLGFSEILAILVLALVVLGPRRLPVAAAAIGKALRDFRRATNEFQDHLQGSLEGDTPSPESPAASRRAPSQNQP
jgi:Tat protein translocase TatB subunit